MSPRSLALPFVVLLTLAACGRRHTEPVEVELPRPVSILVEVYDPITNAVWENVYVRVVEADQEWSGSTWSSPYVDWYPTDASGQVLLDEYALADAAVGFVEDSAGRAVLRSERSADQATVVLEIDAVGYTPVIVEVPLRWGVPDVFVEVPFN